MPRIRYLAAAAILGALAFVAPSIAQAEVPAHFHSSARNVVVEDRTGDGAWSAAVTYAAEEWNKAGVLTITSLPGSGACDAYVPGVILFCQAPYVSMKPYQGYATAVSSNGHISSGKVVVCSDCADDARKWVIAAHEIGHTLGLGHVDNGRSLMCPSGCAAGPTAEDLDMLRANHAHVDEQTPTSQAPGASAGKSCLLILCF